MKSWNVHIKMLMSSFWSILRTRSELSEAKRYTMLWRIDMLTVNKWTFSIHQSRTLCLNDYFIFKMSFCSMHKKSTTQSKKLVSSLMLKFHSSLIFLLNEEVIWWVWHITEKIFTSLMSTSNQRTISNLYCFSWADTCMMYLLLSLFNTSFTNSFFTELWWNYKYLIALISIAQMLLIFMRNLSNSFKQLQTTQWWVMKS